VDITFIKNVSNLIGKSLNLSQNLKKTGITKTCKREETSLT